MPNYFLGLDNGGTLCKAVIFDEYGKEIAGASRNMRLLTPHAGHTERDMDALWLDNCAVIREVLSTPGVVPSDIKGIACCGHGKGLYLWGKDGKPCYPGIVSTDSRAWAYPERWNRDGTANQVFEKTCQQILACQPVSLLNWLRDHQPEVMNKIRWIFEVKDYIRFMLTGQAFAEITDYSGSGLLNLRNRSFDRDLLREYGLEDMYEALPPLKGSAEPCGSVSKTAAAQTGLIEGTPVAGGMFDIDACAVAMDITDEENIAVIAGTWSINEYIAKEPVLDHSVMMNSLYCIDGYYLVEESSPTSAGNYSWFADMFLAEEKQAAAAAGMNLYAYGDKLAETVTPEEQNIIFLPYLYGSNYNPQAKAAVIGLDSHHTRPQIIRAVLENIAFCHRVHIDALRRSRSHTRALRLAGGAANSHLWAQIFADVMGLPVELVNVRELGALGCAMAASVAAGLYADLPAAARAMVRIQSRIEPDATRTAVYEDKFRLYRQVSETMDSLWKNMQP